MISVLETLVVKITGDASAYHKMVKGLAAPVEAAAKKIDSIFIKLSDTVDAVWTRMQRRFQQGVRRAIRETERVVRDSISRVRTPRLRERGSFLENLLGLGNPFSWGNRTGFNQRLRAARARFLAQIASAHGHYDIAQLMRRRASAHSVLAGWDGVLGPKGGRPRNVRRAQRELADTKQWMIAWRGRMGDTASGFRMLGAAATGFGLYLRTRVLSGLNSILTRVNRIRTAAVSMWGRLRAAMTWQNLKSFMSWQNLRTLPGRAWSGIKSAGVAAAPYLMGGLRGLGRGASALGSGALSLGTMGLAGLRRSLPYVGRGLGMGLGMSLTAGLRAANLATSFGNMILQPFRFAMNSALQATQTFTLRFAKAIRRLGYDISFLGRRISFYITAPLMGLGTLAANEFKKFDDALVSSMALLDEVGPGMRKALEDTIFGISSKSRTDPTSLARSVSYLASAGYSGAEAAKMLPLIEKFSIAGAFDIGSHGMQMSPMYAMAEATNYLIDTQTALGERTADVDKNYESMVRITNVLTKANQIANATVEDFSKSLTNKGAAALRLLNKSMEEGVAVLAAYAAQGIKGQTAGEKLYILLRDTQRAALKNAAVWKNMGLSVFDATGKMLPIADIIEQLEKRFAGMSDEQKRVTFMMLGFQDRSLAATLQILGMSKAIREFQKLLEDADGSVDRVANERLTSFASQLAMTANQIRIAAIRIGELLLPTMLFLNEQVQNAVKWWNSLSRVTQRWTLYLGAVVAMIGPFLVFAGTLGLIGASLITAVKTFAVFIGFVGQFVAVLAVLGAAIAAIVYYIGGKEGLVGAWTMATDAMFKFGRNAIGFIENFQHNWGVLTKWMNENWNKIMENITNSFAHNFSTAFETFWRLASASFGWFVRKVDQIFQYDFVNAVGKGLSKAFDWIEQWTGLFGLHLKAALGKPLSMEEAKRILDFQAMLRGDLEGGAAEENLLATLQKIWDEQAAKFKNPMEGIAAPNFLTQIKEDTADTVAATLKPITKLSAAFEELHDDLEEPINMNLGGGGGIANAEATIRGSQEHLARLLAYSRGLPEGAGGAVPGMAVGRRTFAFIQQRRANARANMMLRKFGFGPKLKTRDDFFWEKMEKFGFGRPKPIAEVLGGPKAVEEDKKMINAINSASPERPELMNMEDYLGEMVKLIKTGNDLERKKPAIKFEPANIGG